jgi:hypothetical protein
VLSQQNCDGRGRFQLVIMAAAEFRDAAYQSLFAKALPECDLRNFSNSNLATLGKGGVNQYLHSASRPIL